MRNTISCFMVMLILFISNSVVSAQWVNYWDRPEDMLNDQDKYILDLAVKALDKYPPQYPEPLERLMAHAMIDGVLHNTGADERKSIHEYFEATWVKGMEEIEKTQVNKGAMIWKFYLSGFVVRTPTVTLAFDLTGGRENMESGVAAEDDVLKRIINQCDALFISHSHPDHANEWVAQAFIDQGKPVVSPIDTWKDKPIHKKITHFESVPHLLHKLSIQNGKRELRVVLYPGHQATFPNNVSLVFTPEGMSFSHTGDQGGNRDDFIWMDEVGRHYSVDVLMPNCWSRDLVRMANGFNPRLIIPGHQNAMGHKIDHREPFWLTYQRAHGVNSPMIQLSYGESYHYIPSEK